jgi:hypothetical protein
MEMFGYNVKFSDDDKTKAVKSTEKGIYPRLNFNNF